MRTFAAAVTTSFGSSTNRPGQSDLLFAAIFSAASAASARLEPLRLFVLSLRSIPGRGATGAIGVDLTSLTRT